MRITLAENRENEKLTMNGVSSGSETKESHNPGLLAKVMSPLLHSWLLIVATGLIVLWLSIDALPLACTRLLQMIDEWDRLRAASGNALLAPFAVLLLQIVCFLAAWIMLVLVIVREILALRGGSGQMQSSSSTSAAAPITSLWEPEEEANAAAPQQNANEYIPFDMDSAIFELQPDQEEAEPEEEEQDPLAAAIVEEEAIFVYGDPLAGDLPEIFNYDSDLMRDVQDRHEKASTRIQMYRDDNHNMAE
jgi:hypothetical protein